jgi:hypothetical protein
MNRSIHYNLPWYVRSKRRQLCVLVAPILKTMNLSSPDSRLMKDRFKIALIACSSKPDLDLDCWNQVSEEWYFDSGTALFSSEKGHHFLHNRLTQAVVPVSSSHIKYLPFSRGEDDQERAMILKPRLEVVPLPSLRAGASISPIKYCPTCKEDNKQFKSSQSWCVECVDCWKIKKKRSVKTGK